MNPSRSRIRFWCLLAVQAAGAMTILWKGVPVYRGLLSPGPHGADFGTIALALGAIFFMQLGYWIAFRLQQRLHFHKNVLVGHMLLCLGELSFIFVSALATVVLFERLEEVVVVPWKPLVLAAILFGVFCYKHQLETLGERMIKGEPSPADQADAPSKGSADAPRPS